MMQGVGKNIGEGMRGLAVLALLVGIVGGGTVAAGVIALMYWLFHR